MNLDQLRTFCTVAKTLSFTETAKILMISQPAVSRQIATLETELGAKLFKRANNTLILTRAGMLLFEELPGKLSDLEKTFFNTHLVSLGKIRRIKIGVLRDQQPDAKFLDVCRSMRTDNYYVRLQQYPFQEFENALLQRDIDVAVSLFWIPNIFRGCPRFIYMEESLCLAVNMEFTPEIPKKISRDALEKFSIMRPTMIPGAHCFPKGQYKEVAQVISRFWTGVTEEDLDVVVPMVQSGIGSALVNENHILCHTPEILFKPVDFLEPVKKGIFWLEENPNDAVKDFVNRMKNLESQK